jgi:hypothetical protein
MTEIVTGPGPKKKLGPKVSFCLIAPDQMYTKTAIDMCRAAGYASEVLGCEVAINHHSGSVLAEARQDCIKAAIEWGADWLFCVDSDMRFPVNAIEGMMAHDLPVLAANCSKRKRPVGPTARRRNAGFNDERESDVVWPDPNVRGIEQVETVGFGVVLIKSEVFKRIEWPWFEQPWHEAAQRAIGEDIMFCIRCRDAGIPIHIDHDLSWAVRHIGAYEFGMNDVLAERALAESGAWQGKPGADGLEGVA